jgi:hypothetical protein
MLLRLLPHFNLFFIKLKGEGYRRAVFDFDSIEQAVV